MKPFLVIGSGVFFLLILITGGLIIYLTRDNNGPTETQNPGSIYLFVDVCSFQRENNNSRIGTFRGITKYIEDVAMLGITHLMIIETNVGVLPGRTMADLKQLVDELRNYHIEASVLTNSMGFFSDLDDSAYNNPSLFQTYEDVDDDEFAFYNPENMFMNLYWRKMLSSLFNCGVRDYMNIDMSVLRSKSDKMNNHILSIQNYIYDSHMAIVGCFPSIFYGPNTYNRDNTSLLNQIAQVSIFKSISSTDLINTAMNSTEFRDLFKNDDGTRTITLYDNFYEDFGIIYAFILFSPITIILPEGLGIYYVFEKDNHQTIIEFDQEESRQYITAKYVLNYKKYNTSFTEGQDLILVHELSNQTFIGVAGSTIAKQDKEYILIVINNSDENIDVPVATLSNLVSRPTFDLIYDSSKDKQEIIRVTSQKVRVRSVQCIVLKAL